MGNLRILELLGFERNRWMLFQQRVVCSTMISTFVLLRCLNLIWLIKLCLYKYIVQVLPQFELSTLVLNLNIVLETWGKMFWHEMLFSLNIVLETWGKMFWHEMLFSDYIIYDIANQIHCRWVVIIKSTHDTLVIMWSVWNSRILDNGGCIFRKYVFWLLYILNIHLSFSCISEEVTLVEQQKTTSFTWFLIPCLIYVICVCLGAQYILCCVFVLFYFVYVASFSGLSIF